MPPIILHEHACKIDGTLKTPSLFNTLDEKTETAANWHAFNDPRPARPPRSPKSSQISPKLSQILAESPRHLPNASPMHPDVSQMLSGCSSVMPLITLQRPLAELWPSGASPSQGNFGRTLYIPLRVRQSYIEIRVMSKSQHLTIGQDQQSPNTHTSTTPPRS